MRSDMLIGASADGERDGGTSRLAELRADKSGAIMIMALMMAVFLVGMLFYLVGLTEAVVFREKMQDASDSGAFAAAVTNARGMNLIVLLNIIMSIVVAVVIMVRMIQMLIGMALVLAIAFNFTPFCAGCATPAISLLYSMQRTMQPIANGIDRVAKQIVNAANTGQKLIAYAWPVVGQAASYSAVAEGPFSPPANVGIAFPIYGSLPVEDHEFRETCDRGKAYATYLVGAPFEIIPIVGGKIADLVRGAAGRLYDYYAAVYCGGPSVEAPCFDNEEIPVPLNSDSKACRDQCQGDSAGYSGCSACAGTGIGDPGCDRALAEVCHDGAQDSNRSGLSHCPPDQFNSTANSSEEGCNVARTQYQGCRDPQRENAQIVDQIDGPSSVRPSYQDCQRRVAAATQQCQAGDVDKITYAQEQRYFVWWGDRSSGTCVVRGYDVDEWDSRLPRSMAEFEVGTTNGTPPQCSGGWGPYDAGNGSWSDGSAKFPWPTSCFYDTPEQWRTFPELHRDLNGNPPAPSDPTYGLLCDRLAPTQDQAISRMVSQYNGGLRQNATGEWKRISVTSEIYGCVREESVCVDADAVSAPDVGTWKPPKQVCRFGRGNAVFSLDCPDSEGSAGELHMGDQDFQMRTIAHGEAPSGRGRAGTRLATWGRGEDIGSISTAANQVGRFSIAQAEYYWEQDLNWRDSNLEHSLHGDRREWMWDMAWRGRFRRVSFSDGSAAGRSCSSTPGGDCGGISSMLNRLGGVLEEFFLH